MRSTPAAFHIESIIYFLQYKLPYCVVPTVPMQRWKFECNEFNCWHHLTRKKIQKRAQLSPQARVPSKDYETFLSLMYWTIS